MRTTSKNTKACSKKVSSKEVATRKAAAKKEAPAKDASMNQAPQVSEHFKALSLQRREGFERLQGLSWPQAADEPRSHEACLKLLTDISALTRKQAALELKCAEASMKHGKRLANSKYNTPELAAAWVEKTECHRQMAAALAEMSQKFKAMHKAMSKGDAAKFRTLLKEAEASIKH